MSLLLKTAISLLIILATAVFLPRLSVEVLGLVLRCVGWVIQKRTRSRRKYIVSRVAADEEEFQSKRARSSPRTQTEDEDWEKVETYGTGSTGGAKVSGSQDEWNGIIGFFHPFWCVIYRLLA